MSEQIKSSNPSGKVPLMIPEGIRYNCQGCGRCCTGHAIGLSEEDYQRINKTDWGSIYPELQGKELYTHREKEYAEGLSIYPHFTKTNENGECTFLLNNLCSIHAAFGEAEKPNTCKLFPYTFVPTPSGIYVGVAMSSMAAVRNVGELLTDQREQLEVAWHLAVKQEFAHGKTTEEVALLADSISAETMSSVKFDVNLVAGAPLTWEEYLLVESRVLQVVQSDEFSSIFHVFLAISDVLAQALSIKASSGDLSTLSDFKPSIDRWIGEKPGVFENLVFNIVAFRNNEWPEIRSQYKANWSETSSKSPLTQPGIFTAALRTVFQGRMKIKKLGLINLDKAKKYKVEKLEPEVDAFLRRWIYQKIFSKTYCGPSLSGLSMIAGFNNMASNFLSSVTYAKAHAVARGDKKIRMEDLYEAFFLADKEASALTYLPKDKAQFYDNGFSSARLFCRLLGQISETVG